MSPDARSRPSSAFPARGGRARAGGFGARGLACALSALAVVSGSAAAAAGEPQAGADRAAVVEPEGSAAPPVPRGRSYLQYGVAFTSEAVASAGPVCGDPTLPCILGSGGGVRIGVGWRPTENLYLGGAYEFSKQDASKLFRLPILQQLRCDLRYYFHTGKSVQPFILGSAGVAVYGNEWGISTWGPSATVGGGLEVEFSRGAVIDLTLGYRPIYLRSFYDSTPAYHDAGVAHLIVFEVALEAQDPI